MARGSIRQRGKSWAFVVDLPRGPDGKRRQEWHGGFTTREAAERGLTKRLYEIDQHIATNPSDMTVAEWMSEWLHAHNPEPATYYMYRKQIRNHIAPRLGTLRLRDLTPVHVQRWVNALVAAGYAASTVQLAYITLSAACKHALAFGMVPMNPCAPIKRPSIDRQVTRNYWQEHEARAFLSVIDDPAHAIVFRLALSTGLRIGELLALRWRDIDLDGGELAVVRTWTVTRDGQRVLGTRAKRTASRRMVALDRQVVLLLREHRARQQATRLSPWAIDELVFCRRDGAPVQAQAVALWLKRYAQQAGVRAITPHGMRHTYATLALAHGVPVKVVSERLGHARTTTTLDLYGHVLPGMQRDAAELIGGLLDGYGSERQSR